MNSSMNPEMLYHVDNRHIKCEESEEKLNSNRSKSGQLPNIEHNIQSI